VDHQVASPLGVVDGEAEQREVFERRRVGLQDHIGGVGRATGDVDRHVAHGDSERAEWEADLDHHRLVTGDGRVERVLQGEHRGVASDRLVRRERR
jgi:hypothetical protein